ncbi:hypothetical protein O3P69_007116 [Scylla paramamosain]|uniref:G-protein coupled receptors family 1 profile domain-containing protein n=1 Tax=Scylla paramamosain TaxID=85552 RepID=A0AAW0V2D9_SCYPA
MRVISMEGAAPLHDTSFFRMAQVWAWVICVLGVSGNLLTLATAAHQLYLAKRNRRSLKSVRRDGLGRVPPSFITLQADTLLLLHLSLCDLLYCSINLPIIALNYDLALSDTFTPVPSEQFCTASVVFRYLNALAEWMTLGLLAVERCLNMGRVRVSHIFKPANTCVLLVCCWVAALLSQVVPISDHTYGFDNITFKCDMSASRSKMIFYSLETPLPCLLMLMGTASIIYQVWSNKRRLLAAQMPLELVEKRNRSTWRSTALVLCLLTVFLLCVIPNAVYNIVSITRGTNEDVVVALVTFMIYWVQYGVNFILYAAGNRNFRQAYIQFLQAVSETLCPCCHLRSPSPMPSPVPSSHNDGIMAGGVSCRSIPTVRIEDVSKVTPSTPQFREDAWNRPNKPLRIFPHRRMP